ncbi:MAG: FAD-dependent oxidoreductase, partial [Acetivibrio sp.]
MKKCDVVIIGAGPAGIFTALEMLKKGSRKKIIMVEQGKSMEKRRCPKEQTSKCVNCQPYCDITTGFSGAGAFSDGKLSLNYEVGGDLPKLVGADCVQSLIGYTDGIYLDFGADTRVEGVGQEDKIKDIRRKAIKAGLKLVDCPIRHLGTEKAQEIYGKIQEFLLNSGVEIMFGYSCLDTDIRDGKCYGVTIENARTHEEEVIAAQQTVIATGRKGADWLEKLCSKQGV